MMMKMQDNFPLKMKIWKRQKIMTRNKNNKKNCIRKLRWNSCI